MPRILVVGDVVDDIVVRPLTHVTAASDTNAEIRMHAGGSAANVAAWLGWLGADVTFVGRAGAAGVGRHRSALEELGVDVRIVADPVHVTATIVLTLDGSGERTMYVDRGANAALVPDDVADDVWDGADGQPAVSWLHLTGYSFFDDAVRPTARSLLETARERGVGVSIDPSSLAFLRDCGGASFLDWTQGADLVFPNVDEGRELAGEQEPRRIVRALGSTYRTVVLTVGADGAVSYDADSDELEVPSLPATVVDTTGAGDAYSAGFLAAWTSGATRFTAMTRGAEAAALAVARIGARPPA